MNTRKNLYVRLGRALPVMALLPFVGLASSGCAGGTPMHSVSDVRATFAHHNLPLSVVTRTKVSTSLLPTPYVRALQRTPALGTPPPGPGYEVVVVTNRRSLRHLPSQREIRRTLGMGGSPLSQISTRRDNVFIVYPAGAPKNLARLKRILDDI